MRKTTLLLAACCVFAACKKAPPAEPPAPRTRPLQADGTTERSIAMLPDKVKVNNDLSTLRTMIKGYQIEHDGKSPGALTELDLANNPLNYPDDLSYDPSSGTVKSKTYPDY